MFYAWTKHLLHEAEVPLGPVAGRGCRREQESSRRMDPAAPRVRIWLPGHRHAAAGQGRRHGESVEASSYPSRGQVKPRPCVPRARRARAVIKVTELRRPGVPLPLS